MQNKKTLQIGKQRAKDHYTNSFLEPGGRCMNVRSTSLVDCDDSGGYIIMIHDNT